MDLFLTKFVNYFGSRDFKFLSSDFNPSQVERTSLLTKLSVTVISGLEFGALGSLFFEQSGKSTDANLLHCLNEYSKLGEVIGIYLKYGQPVILVVIDGESLDDEKMLGRYMVLHQLTIKMQDFSMRIMGGKLPTRTLAFTVFKTHSKAIHFKEDISPQCKKHSLFNKAWVLPYTVDLERKRAFAWSGLPLTEFKESLMDKVLFD